MAIITILASLSLGAVGRAYARAKRLRHEPDAPAPVYQIRERTLEFARTHPGFPELSLSAFIQACSLDSRCAGFLRSRAVTYHPFSSADPAGKVVIVHVIRREGRDLPLTYSKGWLCTPAPE